LVFDESFRHFKPTVTNWHNLNFRFRIADFGLTENDFAGANRKSKIQILKSCRRVSPGECGFTSSDGDPGTNGATSKTRCGTGNEHQCENFASADFTHLQKEAHARKRRGAIP